MAVELSKGFHRWLLNIVGVKRIFDTEIKCGAQFDAIIELVSNDIQFSQLQGNFNIDRSKKIAMGNMECQIQFSQIGHLIDIL